MRIACVTPFFALSAVGDVALRVALEMERAGHEIVLVGTGRAPLRATTLPFKAAGEFGRIDPDYLAQFDAVVYHAANDPSAAPIFWLLERVPGIVILHDRTYVHGLDGYTRRFLGAPGRFEAMAQRWYGPPGVAFVRRFRAWQAEPDDIERFTFVEAILDLALAAVVHYEEFGERVRTISRVPVESAHRPSHPPLHNDAIQRAPKGEREPFLLAYVGCVTPYRCLPVLFEALRDRPDILARVHVRILGQVDDPAFAESLQSTAAALGVEHAVSWAFHASDEAKHDLLASADAAFNCRTLNSEGMSWSLMEEMAYGLPVIVNADGFAREAPADAVCFVDRADMKQGIGHALEMLIHDPVRRRRIGERAREWSQNSSSTRAYAESIVRLAEATAGARPAMALRGRVRAVSEEMGNAVCSPFEDRINTELAELLSGPAPQ